MKLIICILSIVSSNVFGQSQPDFYVRATGHFCYQDFDDAMAQVTHELQSKAEKLCRSQNAIKVTDDVYRSGNCSVTLEAGFSCKGSDAVNSEKGIICRKKGTSYIVKCCDQETGNCWIE